MRIEKKRVSTKQSKRVLMKTFMLCYIYYAMLITEKFKKSVNKRNRRTSLGYFQ